jgi:hypothetical protein
LPINWRWEMKAISLTAKQTLGKLTKPSLPETGNMYFDPFSTLVASRIISAEDITAVLHYLGRFLFQVYNDPGVDCLSILVFE